MIYEGPTGSGLFVSLLGLNYLKSYGQIMSPGNFLNYQVNSVQYLGGGALFVHTFADVDAAIRYQGFPAYVDLTF